MAGDDDFIKSGREGGAGLWAGWAGLLKAVYRYATLPPPASFPHPHPIYFAIHCVHEFRYITLCLAEEMAAGIK